MGFMIRVLMLLLMFVQVSFAYTNNIVAIINGEHVVSEYDIMQRKKLLKFANNELKGEEAQQTNLILDKMIQNYLIINDSSRFGITVENIELQNMLNEIAKNNNLTVAQIYNKLNKYDISKEIFMDYIKEQLLVDKMKQSLSFSRARVSNEEIENEVQRVLNLNGKVEFLLYEIIINVNDSKEQARKKINYIAQQINNKDQFISMSKKFSDALSASQGGKIGWVPEVFLPFDIREAVYGLKSNQMSEPILLNNQYRLFFLVDVRPLLTIDISNFEHMNQLRNFAQQKLLYEKAQNFLDDYLKELYAHADIQKFNTNGK